MRFPFFTPDRNYFWVFVVIGCLLTGAAIWLVSTTRVRGTDKAHCIMHQRNLQQALRAYQKHKGLDPGDPVDWAKIIGPNLWIEDGPKCPVQGTFAYNYAKVIPENGTLGAPCLDPAHRHPDTSDW